MTMTNRAIEWLTDRGLDVELADRLGLASGRRGAGEALVIPTYRGEQIVARKYRLFDGGKEDSNQRWATEGETCFWNENVLRDTTLDDRPLIITEGHWDAMVAIQCGFPRTVSVPNGATMPRTDGKGTPEDKYAFVQKAMAILTNERFPVVILATDSDGAGQQLMHDLSAHIGRYRCKFVDYGKLSKDLNDVLLRRGPAAVVECLGSPKFVAMKGLYQFSTMPPTSPETVYEIGDETRGMRLMGESYKMRLGDFAVVTGVPGLGKTTWLNDMCCRVADYYGLRVAWASFEQNAQRDMRRNLTRWYNSRGTDFEFDDGGIEQWLDDHHVVVLPDEDEDLTLDWLLDALEGAVTRFECKIVVIDPWNEIEHRRVPGETETDYIGRAIRTIKRFAKKFQVHVILVAHPAKLQKENGKYAMPSLYDISGSANYYNKCDVGIVVHRPNKDETIVKIQKVRHHGTIGRPGEIALSFDPWTARFTETERLA